MKGRLGAGWITYLRRRRVTRDLAAMTATRGQCRPFAASSGVYNLRRCDLAGRCIKSLASMPEARG
jgi:hypothetical protein